MATTRIMPLHIGKGRTESRAISDIIDYVANPQKTDNGNRLAVMTLKPFRISSEKGQREVAGAEKSRRNGPVWMIPELRRRIAERHGSREVAAGIPL